MFEEYERVLDALNLNKIFGILVILHPFVSNGGSFIQSLCFYSTSGKLRTY